MGLGVVRAVFEDVFGLSAFWGLHRLHPIGGCCRSTPASPFLYLKVSLQSIEKIINHTIFDAQEVAFELSMSK